MRRWLTTLAPVLVAGCGTTTSTPAAGSAGPTASSGASGVDRIVRVSGG